MIDSILLVDDESTNNFINQTFLKRSKIANHISAVESAQEAFAFLEKETPELILLDINMPAVSGWDFLDSYTNHLKSDTKPIIVMLTCSVDPRDQERAESNTHVTALINKPLNIAELQKVLDKHFN